MKIDPEKEAQAAKEMAEIRAKYKPGSANYIATEFTEQAYRLVKALAEEGRILESFVAARGFQELLMNLNKAAQVSKKPEKSDGI